MQRRLFYFDPVGGSVTDAGSVKDDEEWYHPWLMSMVDSNDELIFFYCDYTTDIW